MGAERNPRKTSSVLDFEKKMRAEEVAQLEAQIEGLKVDTQAADKTADKAQKRLDKSENHERVIAHNVDKYDKDPEWQLPVPKPLMYAQAYKTKMVMPFIRKLKDVIRSVVAQYLKLLDRVKDLQTDLIDARSDIGKLEDKLQKVNDHNIELKGYVNE